jgi:hypothetical protein
MVDFLCCCLIEGIGGDAPASIDRTTTVWARTADQDELTLHRFDGYIGHLHNPVAAHAIRLIIL